MADFDPAAWLAKFSDLPEGLRRRKAEIQSAALAEIGVNAPPDSTGAVQRGLLDLAAYRAHEISCKAVGIIPLRYDDWVAVHEHYWWGH